ncbi:hypothetical protein MASR2M15_26520 [Anaerolineales bacterium]
MTTTSKPSDWQQQITGVWYGQPSIFDANANHIGYNHVYRSSVFEDGKTTYYMNTVLDANGPLRYRLESSDFAFGVLDSDQDRIYLGPDFIGAGHPHGFLVDANYYSPQWRADLRTMVHILADGQTQIYSSLLYDGPTIFSVFNGIYKVAHDYDENPETKTRIDAFVASERKNGPNPHVLPAKKAGRWVGEMEVYNAMQERIGLNSVVIDYEPISLLRTRKTVQISGIINREYTFEGSRSSHLHNFEGPDVFGNAIAYGRALYTKQHFYNEALKIQGREFIIDDHYTMSVVWQFYASDRRQYTTFGVLNWEES